MCARRCLGMRDSDGSLPSRTGLSSGERAAGDKRTNPRADPSRERASRPFPAPAGPAAHSHRLTCLCAPGPRAGGPSCPLSHSLPSAALARPPRPCPSHHSSSSGPGCPLGRKRLSLMGSPSGSGHLPARPSGLWGSKLTASGTGRGWGRGQALLPPLPLTCGSGSQPLSVWSSFSPFIPSGADVAPKEARLLGVISPRRYRVCGLPKGRVHRTGWRACACPRCGPCIPLGHLFHPSPPQDRMSCCGTQAWLVWSRWSSWP